MKIMQELHNIQKNILKNLLINKNLRFSELNSENTPSDHFTFHVKRLVEQGIISKGEKGIYCLTSYGKEYAGRFDIDSREVIFQKQAKLSILVVPRDNEKRFLVQQRLKEPYYGHYGFVSGKIKWGEPIYEAAARELEEEAGLRAGSLILQGIEHKIDYSKEDGRLLEDKFFYIVEAVNTAGQLKTEFDCGKNQWLNKEQILKLPNLFADVPKIIKAVEQDKLVFFEDRYYYCSTEY